MQSKDRIASLCVNEIAKNSLVLEQKVWYHGTWSEVGFQGMFYETGRRYGVVEVDMRCGDGIMEQMKGIVPWDNTCACG